MKKVLKRIIFVVLLVPILLIIVGFFLPSKYHVERTVVIQAPADAIYPWLAQLNRWPEWTVWSTNIDPTLVHSFSGPAEGPGAEMKLSARSGSGTIKLVKADPASGVTYELNFHDGRFVAQGGVKLVPTGEGSTKATWFGEGELGGNPVQRYFGLFMDKLMGNEFQRNLTKLRLKLEPKA